MPPQRARAIEEADMATTTTRRRLQAAVPRRLARALAVVGASLGALAVWLLTDPLLGIDLKYPSGPGGQQLQPLTPALVVGTSLAVALAGMHLAVAVVLIPILAGSWSTWRPATASSPSPSETTAMSR